MPVVVHGPAYSTYARTVRLALEEKGVAYTLNEVDILTGAQNSPEHLARHPFAKVPALEHDGFGLFETFAITRYIDEAFDGPALQPADAKTRARVTQICAVIDGYGYGAMIGKVFWQLAIVPMQGGTPDQALVAEGMAMTNKVLDAVEALPAEGPGVLSNGETVSLADLHLAPVIAYLSMTPPGQAALATRPRLAAWWTRFSARPSVVRTQPNLG